jgi:hypothetical protein
MWWWDQKTNKNPKYQKTKSNPNKTKTDKMIDLFFKSVSIAFFCWFYEMAIYEVPYLKWIGRWLDKLPDYISDPLGKCPYCTFPWLFLLSFYVFNSEVNIAISAFGFGYAANIAFSKFR